jgi:hypothetical protein
MSRISLMMISTDVRAISLVRLMPFLSASEA